MQACARPRACRVCRQLRAHMPALPASHSRYSSGAATHPTAPHHASRCRRSGTAAARDPAGAAPTAPLQVWVAVGAAGQRRWEEVSGRAAGGPCQRLHASAVTDLAPPPSPATHQAPQAALAAAPSTAAAPLHRPAGRAPASLARPAARWQGARRRLAAAQWPPTRHPAASSAPSARQLRRGWRGGWGGWEGGKRRRHASASGGVRCPSGS